MISRPASASPVVSGFDDGDSPAFLDRVVRRRCRLDNADRHHSGGVHRHEEGVKQVADGAVVERVARVGRDNLVRVCLGVDELDGRVFALHGRNERVVGNRPLVGVRHF